MLGRGRAGRNWGCLSFRLRGSCLYTLYALRAFHRACSQIKRVRCLKLMLLKTVFVNPACLEVSETHVMRHIPAGAGFLRLRFLDKPHQKTRRVVCRTRLAWTRGCTARQDVGLTLSHDLLASCPFLYIFTPRGAHIYWYWSTSSTVCGE